MKMVLTVFVQVLDKISLRLELPRELLGGHVAEWAFLVLRILIPLHDVDVRIIKKYSGLNQAIQFNIRPASGNVRARYLDPFHNGQKSGSGELV